MPKTRIQKEETVVKLTDKLGRAKSVVFADYKGLTMKHLSDVRAKLLDEQAEFSVTKNNLLDLAVKDSTNYQLPTTNFFEGPTATLFSFGDEISPIKVLVKAFKDAQIGPSTTLRIKGGFLNGEFLDAASITKLSTLPSKLELQAKVVGTLAAPLYGMVNVLQGNLRNLVYALEQIRVQKGGE